MDGQIIIALITSFCTLIGTIVTVLAGNKKTEKSVKQSADLTLYRITELEKKQDKHNSIIERTYKVEDRLNVIDERLKVVNHRIDDLERAGHC